MNFMNNLYWCLSIATEPVNIFVCFLGVFIGTIAGVLPGLGATTCIVLLLPATYGLSPTSAIIMLAGIYYGAMYGGSTTSILLNIPGEGSSMITCLDGYQMAKQGKAGPALSIAAIGSFIAGTFSVVMIMIIGPVLAEVALKFGPPEIFAITFLGMILVTYLGRGSMLKGLIMAAVGLMLSYIGTDSMSAKERYVFHIISLKDGIGFLPIMMGLFGIAEVLSNLEKKFTEGEIFKTTNGHFLPNKKELKDSSGPIARGTLVGFALGLIPGGGGILSSLVSYTMEKKLSKYPEKFGTGVIEGVAGPETANNAGAGGSFVPLLTLGFPCHVAMAALLAALMIHGVTPGPLLYKDHPDMFWGVIGSMYIGNVLLLMLNLPLIGLWVKLLKTPYLILFPMIFLFCLIGSYSLNSNIFDVAMTVLFGVIGYLMRKFEYEPAPLIMALILGPMFEVALRQSLIMSNGSPLIFLFRPISSVFIIISCILLFSPFLLKYFGRRRPGLLKEGGDEF